jgi:hypothetical protein
MGAPRFKDETGKKYGKLKVLSFDQIRKGQAFFLCQCECGRLMSVRGANLRGKNTTSCGCSRRKAVPRYRGKMVMKIICGVRVWGKENPASKRPLWFTSCMRCGGIGHHTERKIRGGKGLLCECLRGTYTSWRRMRERCRDNHPQYKLYAGIGVTVCKRWSESFCAFVEDMGIRPNKEMTIHRIEGDKGYYKENCRWATKQDQAKFRRKPIRKKNSRRLKT